MRPTSRAPGPVATNTISGREFRIGALVGLLGLVIVSLIAVRSLYEVDWDVSLFGAFGEEQLETREYAEERLGEVFLRPFQGHDGKFYFVQSNDPWALDPQENASVLDRPLYRSQRMLYPVLAGGAGLFNPETIIWAMLIVNLIAVGVGTWAVAAVAGHMGGSPWWGLAFALNPGFITEMSIGGAGIVAAACAFWGLVFLLRSRLFLLVLMLALAVLAREAMLIMAAGTAFWLWRRGERRESALALGVPIAAVVGWALYLRMRIGWESGVSQVQELGLPFVGFIRAFESWTSDPLDMAMGLVLMLLLLLYTRRVVMSDQLVGWACVGFVPLAFLFTQQVWLNYFDIARAVAPAITAYVLLVFLGAPAIRSTESLAKAQT